MEAMTSFIDAYRAELGVEPICRVAADRPVHYYEHIRRRAKPAHGAAARAARSRS